MKASLTVVGSFTHKNTCVICLTPVLSWNYNGAALQNRKTCQRCQLHPLYASIEVFFKIHVKLCKHFENEKRVERRGFFLLDFTGATVDTADWTAFLLPFAWEKTPLSPSAGVNRTVTDVCNSSKPSPPFWIFFFSYENALVNTLPHWVVAADQQKYP